MDLVGDHTRIVKCAGVDRDHLQAVTMLIATSLRPCRGEDVVMADWDPLAWAPVRLSTDHVKFDPRCLGTVVQSTLRVQNYQKLETARIASH
jgi:hypothetical protein